VGTRSGIHYNYISIVNIFSSFRLSLDEDATPEVGNSFDSRATLETILAHEDQYKYNRDLFNLI
jgi:hypothetical protein